jgi:class 3 adenylate cyclase/pimeloyl-ACP methyl ester carboxylesterase
MEPRIQYAKTEDGVSIAYWTLGEGKPLVAMPPTLPLSHVQLEWHVPEFRRWYQRLSEGRMLVRYDGRGAGLSDRDAADYSLEAHVLDLKAVVKRLALDTFALCGTIDSGPVAIAFAARYPERVSHLVLWCSYARAQDYWQSPRVAALVSLVDKDWELYSETVAHAGVGWSGGEPARRLAAFIRESVAQETLQRVYSAMSHFDVSGLLPRVTSPTLVLHHRQVPFPDVGLARDLASGMPNARLVVLEGTSIAPWAGDVSAVLQAIHQFLNEGEEARVAAEAPEVGAFRTVLFTDVEGSTALTQRLGDAKARELLRQHERIVREALTAHGGSELKTMGDGFMASFSSATRALESAIAMQRSFAQHNQSAEEPMVVRIGLNAGEPIAEDEDLFGTAVIEAARIAAAAKGGEILVSNVVRELAKGKDFVFVDRGDVTLKGFDEPVRLYEVRWEE